MKKWQDMRLLEVTVYGRLIVWESIISLNDLQRDDYQKEVKRDFINHVCNTVHDTHNSHYGYY